MNARGRGSAAIVALAAATIAAGACGRHANPARQSATDAPSGATTTARPGSSRPESPAQALSGSESIGSAPEAVLRFVSDEIRNEPYAGVLRGAQETLRARAGGDADKALLLHDLLLGKAGVKEVRFAFGTVSETDAAAWVRAAIRDGTVPARVPAATRDQLLARMTPQARRAFEDIQARWTSALDEARATARDIETEIRANADPASAAADALRYFTATTRHHVWIQARIGSAWTDMDPTIAGARPGQRRAAAESTADRLPESLAFRCRIAVFAERRQNGHTDTFNLVEASAPVADLIGAPITYLLAEPWGFEDQGGPPPSSGNQRYTPVIVIGDRAVIGQPFELPDPNDNGIGALAGGIAGMLGSHGLGPAGGSRPGPETTAVGLQIVVERPDGTAEIVERPIFDRTGYTARAAGQVETAPLAKLDTSDGDYTALRGIWSIAISAGASVSAPTAPAATARGRVRTFADALQALSASAYAYSRARALMLRDLDPAATFFSDGPDVSLLAWRPGKDQRADQMRLDAVLSHLTPGAFAEAEAPVRHAQLAAASLTAERLIATPPVPATSSGRAALPAFHPEADVNSVFATARGDATPIVTLRASDAAKVRDIPASDEARARAQAELAAGNVLVVPSRGVPMDGQTRLGWWVLDPGRATALDEMDDGTHQSGAESMNTQGEAKKNAAAARSGFWKKFKIGVCILGASVGLTISGANGYVDIQQGNVGDFVEVVDGFDDQIEALAECLLAEEGGGEAETPTPVDAPGADPKRPWGGSQRFDPPRNSPRPADPYLSKRPFFRGNVRGR